MRWKLLDRGPPATYAVVLAHGDEAIGALGKFVREQRIDAASLTAIGAFERATIGWFDLAAKNYRKIEVNEQCEVLSAIGDIAMTASRAFMSTSCWGSPTVRPAAVTCWRAR